MSFRKQVFAAAYAVTLCGVPFNLAAQQTTKDGVRLENAVNRPERPYRPAGSSDPRDRGPHVAKGFGKRDRRLVYVALPGGSAGGQFSSEMNGVGIVVLDVDRNFEFVKRIPTWNVPASISPEEVSGVAASPATNMIYLATRGRLAAFDLGTDQKVWENTYDGTCCERPEVTPDGKTLVVGSDLKDFWYVIDAQSGALKGKIQAPKSMFAHNMALSADGKTVFMAPNGVTMTVGDVPSMKAIKTITFSDHVRPFVINHDATRVYANLNNLLGFEIADVKTGEVIKRIEAPAEMWKAKWADVKQHFFGHGCPSHGIALTPDESEIWVVDNINYGVLVYDNTGEWPVLRSSFPDDGLRRLDHDGNQRAVRLAFVGRRCRREDQEDRRPDEGRVRKAHAQREVPGDVLLQREAGADGEPVRRRHPERRAGEARRPRADGEQK